MVDVWMLVVTVLYLLVPGGVANMMPVLVKRHFKSLAKPIDFGYKWRGKPLFGSHKTFRGFIFGIIGAIIIVYLQRLLYQYEFFRNISLLNYNEFNILLLGFLMGFGVLFGDAVESFFKRRSGIAPGKPWIPWDQLDCVIGGLVFISLYWIPPWEVVVTSLIMTMILHIGINLLGYYLGIKKNML